VKWNAIIVGRPTYCQALSEFPAVKSHRRYFECQWNCCILFGPDEESILDLVPGGTELGTQVKTGSRAGGTLSQ